MKIKKQIFLAFAIILINGCNSKNSKIESTSQKNQVEVNQEVKISSEKSIKKEFRLTDDNVIDFLFDYKKNNKENHIRIYTSFGEIDILLYNNTPYHRSNFIYLTKKKYFEGTQFYRVINDFVIQAGNSDNIKVSEKRREIGKYLLPNDFNKGHTHKRGVVSMPSSSVDNPYKMASPFEFFIVQKKDGAHHLNGNYTVFGEVIDGMETVDRIANLATDNRDWPLNNVYINKVEIINVN
jgi:peptidyl-prolyl cis-trans isomerase A (cyclophilin A)